MLDCPGYTFQALVTNLPASVPPLEVWRQYNPRAGCEEVIKQLDMDFALPKLCLAKFWATEAALSMAILSYNLTQLFQRHLGWMDRVTATTLRFRLFTTGGILSEKAGVTTIRLAVREEAAHHHRPGMTRQHARLAGGGVWRHSQSRAPFFHS